MQENQTKSFDTNLGSNTSHKINDIAERAKSRILSSLANAKFGSPKGALFSLCKSEILDRRLVDLWIELRNKAAHADELNFEPHEFQEFLNSLYGCLELFYRLIFQVVGYKRRMINYSVSGWPESTCKGTPNPSLKGEAQQPAALHCTLNFPFRAAVCRSRLSSNVRPHQNPIAALPR